MSIKIYNGFVFKESSNSCYFDDFLSNFQQVKDNIIRKKKKKMIYALYMQYIFGKGYNKLSDIEFKPFEKEEIYSDNLSLVVFPSYNNKHYCMIFSDNADQQILCQELNLDEYGYFDNVDIPEDISDEEWDQRRAVWNNVLQDFSLVPAQAGITFNSDLSIYDITQDDFDEFKNTIDHQELKTSLFKSKFYKKMKGKRGREIEAAFGQLSKDELQKEIDLIELSWNFSFDINPQKENFKPVELNSINNNQSLNDVILLMLDIYKDRYTKIKESIKEQYSETDLDSYFKNEIQIKKSEVIHLSHSDSGYVISSCEIPLFSSSFKFNFDIDTFIDINIDKVLFEYIFDKGNV